MDGRQLAAQAVAARRGELDMTQQQLADAASVDIKTIGNLESRGRWPIARTRARIEKALGWPSGELERIAAGDEGQPPPPVLSPELQHRMRQEVGDELATALIAHAEHLASGRTPPAPGAPPPESARKDRRSA